MHLSFHDITTSLVSPDSAQSDIISNRGKYLMKYSIGMPLVPILGIADTSSDLIWLQCKPYTKCSIQTAPPFYPEMSTTYKSISCTSSKITCYGHSHSGINNKPSMPLLETIIGCGHDNVGNFDNKGSDIVGIRSGAVSLVSQLSSSIGGKDKKLSKLNHFEGVYIYSGRRTMSTPLVPKILDTFYFLTLDGNIVIESGTTLTMLPKEFYSKFESAVAEEINLERGDDPSDVLTYFTGADVKLNPATTFVQINEELVIFGYDLVEKTVSFKPTDCINL
ncbi:hypothetical protein ACJW31_11G118600 [Castanea mollissima]